jgi:uncharacterized protein (TIGR00730 family)
MRVCVYCASSSNVAVAHVDMARHTGTWIGQHGHTLFWGGCKLGLMQVVGEAAQQAGGRVVAVLPRFLAEHDIAFETPDERVVTETLAARKSYLRENADVFVALPGGVGTWDEVIEVLALKKLARLDAPVVLANVEGYFDPLLQMIERSVSERFSPPDFARLFRVARDARDMSRVLCETEAICASNR